MFFTEKMVYNYEKAKASDTKAFADYFNFMLNKGNYFGASQFEAIFISASHTTEDIEKTLYDAEEYFKNMV